MVQEMAVSGSNSPRDFVAGFHKPILSLLAYFEKNKVGL
jgi:hypothetical protein